MGTVHSLNHLQSLLSMGPPIPEPKAEQQQRHGGGDSGKMQAQARWVPSRGGESPRHWIPTILPAINGELVVLTEVLEEALVCREI